MSSLFYVGMDVHKDTVRMAVLKGREKETVYEGTLKNDIARIVKRSIVGPEIGPVKLTLDELPEGGIDEVFSEVYRQASIAPSPLTELSANAAASGGPI